MPSSLPELDAQYRALREEAGVLRRDDLSLISVRGAEAAEFLQGQLTNDIEALEVGGGCYAALLDRKGKVQADARVLRIGDGEFLLITERDCAPTLVKHLGTYNVGRDAAVEQPDGWAVLSLAGPRSVQLIGPPLGALESHREVAVDGTAARAVSTWIGADLLVDAVDVEAMVAALLAAGAEPIADEALEIARVEAGIPRVGREIGPTTIPQEAGINERAVSFTKGCYIGQETVARLHYKGKPNRQLRRLLLAEPAAAGAAVVAGDKQVGTIGTFALSPVRGPLALAVLRREAEPGTEVKVDGDTVATVEAID